MAGGGLMGIVSLVITAYIVITLGPPVIGLVGNLINKAGVAQAYKTEDEAYVYG